MRQNEIVEQILAQRQQPARTNALELAITLAKVERMCRAMLDDDEDPLGAEAYQVVTLIQRLVNHRDLSEAQALLRLRERVEALAKAYKGSSREFLGDDLYMDLADLAEGDK